jgi:hypothetical protein
MSPSTAPTAPRLYTVTAQAPDGRRQHFAAVAQTKETAERLTRLEYPQIPADWALRAVPYGGSVVALEPWTPDTRERS